MQVQVNIWNDIQEIHILQYNFRNGNGNKEAGFIQLEQEILAPLAGTGTVYAMQVTKWWSQVKTAGSAIYANRHYLQLYYQKHPERLIHHFGSGEPNAFCKIIPDVHIHPSANIHPTAVVSKYYIKCLLIFVVFLL